MVNSPDTSSKATQINPSGATATQTDLKTIATAYSSPPWWYDLRGFFVLTFTYQTTLPALVRFFARNVSPKHLEIAIGSGSMFQLVLWYRRLKKWPAGSIIGMDYSDAMLAGARRRFASLPNLVLYQEDVCALRAEDGSVESVNLANCIHCFVDPDAALREIHRILVPGGTVAVNVLLYPRERPLLRNIAAAINRWGIRKGLLINLFTEESIDEKVAAAGFEVQQRHLSGNCYFFVARKAA